MFEKLKTCWNLKGGSHIDFQIQCVIMAFLAIPNDVLRTSHSSSYNLTPPISRVLIGPHLIFCSLTSPTWCNSPGKCTPVKYKAKQKLGFQLSHRQPPGPNPDVTFPFKSYVNVVIKVKNRWIVLFFSRNSVASIFVNQKRIFNPARSAVELFLHKKIKC